jgi:serine/threonine protein kinase
MRRLSEDLTRYASIDIDVSRPPRDRYQILGHLSTSLLVDVYLARMFTGPGGWQEFMVRQLRPAFQARDSFVRAIVDEAIAAAPLRHEGIAATVEVGHLSGAFFVSTELIRGVTLRELHRRAMSRGDAIPMQFALKIASDALTALARVHESGLVHASVSPDAIYVTYKGSTKLVDVALANAETRASRPLNSPYASPEQSRGEEASPRSDLFSLGLILYELVMNRAIDDESSEVAKVIRSGGSLRELLEGVPIPAALGLILDASLAVDAARRYRDAASMQRAIDDYQRERARAASQENVGRFVQDLFTDRLRTEERARLNRDDQLLVKSLEMTARSLLFRDVRDAANGEAGRPSPVDATITPDMEIVIDTADPQTWRPGEVRFDDETSPGAAETSHPAEPFLEATVRSPSTLGTVGGYRLLKRLGFGSMAEVFLARKEGDPSFESFVAVKRILPELASEERFVDLFLTEARLAGRLSHPNVVQIYDFGTDAAGNDFIAMEYVEGWDLATVLDRCRARKQQIPIPIALRIMSHVSAALHAGHTARDEEGQPLRIVHRDVAPQNILLSVHGQVKLTDFGIAKANDSAISTRVGEIRGKPAYMAPERMVPDPEVTLGRPGELMPITNASERADIFSVGVVLFEILTLVPLFRRETAFSTLMAAQRDPIPPMSKLRADVPRALDAIVAKAASRWPSERHPTAHALQTEIERVLEEESVAVYGAQIAAWLRALFSNGDADEVSTDAGMLRQEAHDENEILTAVMPREPSGS